jgi:hypothetical protein
VRCGGPRGRGIACKHGSDSEGAEFFNAKALRRKAREKRVFQVAYRLKGLSPWLPSFPFVKPDCSSEQRPLFSLIAPVKSRQPIFLHKVTKATKGGGAARVSTELWWPGSVSPGARRAYSLLLFAYRLPLIAD